MHTFILGTCLAACTTTIATPLIAAGRAWLWPRD